MQQEIEEEEGLVSNETRSQIEDEFHLHKIQKMVLTKAEML